MSSPHAEGYSTATRVATGVFNLQVHRIRSAKEHADSGSNVARQIRHCVHRLTRSGSPAVSRFHHDHPYTLQVNGHEHRVDYEPAESSTGLFGGNSNWRGPIWFPLNFLLIESLQKFHFYLGDGFKVECPTGSGKMMTLWQVAGEISQRLTRIFMRDEAGRRPVFGGTDKFQTDPHWRDVIPFHEYFHGDNGTGIGASHQTGWTALVAKLIQQYGE